MSHKKSGSRTNHGFLERLLGSSCRLKGRVVRLVEGVERIAVRGSAGRGVSRTDAGLSRMCGGRGPVAGGVRMLC